MWRWKERKEDLRGEHESNRQVLLAYDPSTWGGKGGRGQGVHGYQLQFEFQNNLDYMKIYLKEKKSSSRRRSNKTIWRWTWDCTIRLGGQQTVVPSSQKLDSLDFSIPFLVQLCHLPHVLCSEAPLHSTKSRMIDLTSAVVGRNPQPHTCQTRDSMKQSWKRFLT